MSLILVYYNNNIRVHCTFAYILKFTRTVLCLFDNSLSELDITHISYRSTGKIIIFLYPYSYSTFINTSNYSNVKFEWLSIPLQLHSLCSRLRYRPGSKLYEFPVIPVEAKDLLDSTGAGDFFVAGALLARSVLPVVHPDFSAFSVKFSWILNGITAIYKHYSTSTSIFV